jgi:glycosyltransferase involved in cell wall biosynthesis
MHIVGTHTGDFGGPIRSIKGIQEVTPAIDHLVVALDEGNNIKKSGVRQISGGRVKRVIFASLGETLRVTREESPDVVHIHGALHMIYAQFAQSAKQLGIPLIVSPRSAFQLPNGGNYFRSIIRLLSLRFFDTRAKVIHCTSIEELEAAGTGLARRVNVSNVFLRKVEPSDFSHRRQGILYLGRITKRKNVDVVVKAWLELPQEVMTRHPLVVAGTVPTGERDPVGKRLRFKAEHYGAKFLGHVSGEEKDELLSTYKVLIHPSQFENFGHAIAEGIASGLYPIVGPNTPFSDSLRQSGNGLVVEATRDVQLLKASMERAAGSRAMAEAAVKILAEFSISRLRKPYEDLYNSVL